ncbi:MAG: hypothetical protein LBK67_13405 [Coriobacteriales bacterium]|nr:hypothetical protein [Coriobacteriales bacterium]
MSDKKNDASIDVSIETLKDEAKRIRGNYDDYVDHQRHFLIADLVEMRDCWKNDKQLAPLLSEIEQLTRQEMKAIDLATEERLSEISRSVKNLEKHRQDKASEREQG